MGCANCRIHSNRRCWISADFSVSGRGNKNIEEGTLTDIHGGAGGHEDGKVIKAGNEELTLFR